MKRSLLHLLVLLALVGGAFAASTGADASIGLRYEKAKVKTVQPGTLRFAQSVHCPAQTRVIGGGVVGSSTPNFRIMGSGPIDGADADTHPDDGWRVIKKNIGLAPQTMQTYAICAAGGRYRYVSERTEVEDDTLGTATALCNDETEEVSGGGTFASGDHTSIQLTRDTPVDDEDVDAERDDGWSGTAKNQSGLVQRMKVWAICAKTGTFNHRESTSTIPNPGSTDHESFCQIGEATTGGGVDITPDAMEIVLSTSGPRDNDSDPGGLADNGWGVSAYNNSGVPQLATLTAICRVL